jgi:hypothetical protein
MASSDLTQQTELRELGESLAFFGAPLAAYAAVPHLGLEETVARALAASHSEASFLRTLPLVLVRQRDRLNLAQLATAAERLGVTAELGMLLELTADVASWPALRAQAQSLPRVPSREPRYFFNETGRANRQLAERRSPKAARTWGFFLNMPEDSFRSLLGKFGA